MKSARLLSTHAENLARSHLCPILARQSALPALLHDFKGTGIWVHFACREIQNGSWRAEAYLRRNDLNSHVAR